MAAARSFAFDESHTHKPNEHLMYSHAPFWSQLAEFWKHFFLAFVLETLSEVP